MPRWLKRLLVALAAPALFLTLLEGVLALCGITVPRYAGLSDPGRYWIPWSAEGRPAGFSRAIPRAYRLFPEPLPLFVERKPADGYRVFVLGESSVKGDPYEVGCFTDWLRLRLSAMLPGRTVEVVNAGEPGWHATDVRLLLQESLGHQPDLLIWMVGHNEFVPHNVLTLRAEVLTPVRHALQLGLWRLRTMQWLARLRPSLRPDERALYDRRRDEEEPCFGPELPLLEQRFREATAGAVADARAAGVPIVLCTLPRNLRDWPPATSYFSEALRGDPALRSQWDAAYERGLQALDHGDAAAAMDDFDQAVALDATPAKLHFARGRAALALGLTEPARAAFLQALANDGGPMRAQDWVEQAIREVAAETATPLVDLQWCFDAAGQAGLAGRELLADQCHPNLTGHELIASAILRVLEQQLELPLDRTQDVSPEEGRQLLDIVGYAANRARQAEALNLVKLALLHGAVDETWQQAHEQCLAVLADDELDAEVGGGLGLLEAIAGESAKARELIEKAMASESYLQASYVFFWKTEPPYQKAFAAAGLDMAAVEAALTPEQKRQIENRLRRSSTR